MAYSVNWETQTITIPQADLTVVGGGVHDLDLIAGFHKEIRRLEWAFDEGLAYQQIMNFVSSVLISGITIAPVVTIINGYSIVFEDVGSPYAVNLVGANSNVADVTVINNVSVRPQNSVGLQIVTSGSGVTEQDKTDIVNGVWADAQATSLQSNVDFIKAIEGGRWDLINNQMIFYDDDNTTEIARFDMFDENNNLTTTGNIFKRLRA